MNAIIIFIQKAIGQGIGILFGANGEILTEKSGNLNLGVPGMSTWAASRAFPPRFCMKTPWQIRCRWSDSCSRYSRPRSQARWAD